MILSINMLALDSLAATSEFALLKSSDMFRDCSVMYSRAAVESLSSCRIDAEDVFMKDFVMLVSI